MAEIYQTVHFLNGTKCEIIMPKAGVISRALKEYSNQNEFDITMFFVVEFCLVDGEERGFDYWTEVSCDDYMKVLEVLNPLLTPIK